MRIAFFGSSQLSCLVLSRLLTSSHEIVCAVSQPDQPAGRSMRLTPTPAAAMAETAGLPVLKPARLRGDLGFIEKLRRFAPEALLTASYGQIIPAPVLDLTPWPLNVHPSLLPQLRGASPVRTALLQGLELTGCCIMRMTPRLDDGDVLLRTEQKIAAEWNYAQLEEVLGTLGGDLAVRALDLIAAGAAVLQPQDHSAATYCPTYSRADTWIDWTRTARELADFVRAWDPDIGAAALLPDGRRIKVWRAQVRGGEATDLPGTVVAADHGEFAIATGAGVLALHEVQPESKRRMSVQQFLAGHSVPARAQMRAPAAV